MTSLVDSFGRVHDTLRVSVTDRCNFRCTYCLPKEGIEWLPRKELLTYEEIQRLVGCFVTLGVRRVRLTGGEPTLRRNLPRLVRSLSDLPGLDDLAMTTNAHALAPIASTLAEAGLQRVNVSLDALDPDVFYRMTRGEDVSRVLKGIDAALAAGLSPIKVNAVVLEGENAIARNREIMGATNPADAAPGTLRALYATDVGENAVHGSDAPETAVEEINYFFRQTELTRPRNA